MTELTKDQLVEQLEVAESKEALEALGKKHLGVDVDKRRGIESIRADLVEAADTSSNSDAGEDADSVGDEAGQGEGSGEQSAETSDAQADSSPTPTDDAPVTGGPTDEHVPTAEQLPRKPKVNPATQGAEAGAVAGSGSERRNRMLENTQNGRRLVWTAALANLPHMREV
ncbi:hypothetical protein [Salinicola sp. DM10]|uniref:hypothetical protein n=1 Tax=Salinicola sp. DM10 TaxID=2815721 RepID=UPI001A8F95D3|nr:hypothetical protein [Salinicola sp. DM10]MCE3025732.1 hypothetical protein [Salinicola sp. DM10]